MAKPRQNLEAVLTTFDLFIYGDILHIVKLFRKNVQKIATP